MIRLLHRLRGLIKTLTLILLLILASRVILQNYHIDGQSMEPTLHDHEYVLVNKAAYLFAPPQRGDIIVFQYPHNPQENYIKRIIAIPGDIISVEGATVTVNGVTLQESYVDQNDNFNPFPPLENRIVGPDQYFVMGDNRGNSADSRQWGLVPRQNIIGKATVIYWPVNEDNFGLLPDASGVFAHVHQ
ncbi:MAG: signal peptidase I [Ktedonobacteraceae bacterium]|nr:signal peptidase I [Ktedonobacteraceae bacterium]